MSDEIKRLEKEIEDTKHKIEALRADIADSMIEFIVSNGRADNNDVVTSVIIGI